MACAPCVRLLVEAEGLCLVGSPRGLTRVLTLAERISTKVPTIDASLMRTCRTANRDSTRVGGLGNTVLVRVGSPGRRVRAQSLGASSRTGGAVLRGLIRAAFVSACAVGIITTATIRLARSGCGRRADPSCDGEGDAESLSGCTAEAPLIPWR